MRLIIDVLELYTVYNDETGDWSGVSCHTEGTLGFKSGSVMSLTQLNYTLTQIGHPPLTNEDADTNPWQEHDPESDPGRFDYTFIGTSDGFPDKDGKYLYDISIWLHKIDPQPVTKAGLFQGNA